MYDSVVTINNTHWPAYRKPGATLVALRMFDPDVQPTKSHKSHESHKHTLTSVAPVILEVRHAS
jgi:hypothetical protein